MKFIALVLIVALFVARSHGQLGDSVLTEVGDVGRSKLNIIRLEISKLNKIS